MLYGIILILGGVTLALTLKLGELSQKNTQLKHKLKDIQTGRSQREAEDKRVSNLSDDELFNELFGDK